MLQTNQADLMSSRKDRLDIRREDRDGAVGSMRNDLALLDQLLAATKDTTVTRGGTRCSTYSRRWAGFSASGCKASAATPPLDMGGALELTGRLRWCAEQALRIYPGPASSTEAVA